jgi:hypothetical protein
VIRTRVTDKSLKTIGQLVSLAELTLDYTDISDAGLESLTGLTNLARLSLDSTNVSDAAAKSLTAFKRLEKLNLYHTTFTEQGHEQIRTALPDCEIIWDPLSSDPTRRRS